ncbi:MAG: hypothetical protein K2O45_05125 [Oscillospiraceae bacterium]|nr:hypothetical protein [Oscillospiraceae bacterium]
MTNKPEKETGKKKRSFLNRMLTLLLVLCAVLGAVALTAMEDGTHFAALRRWLMYGSSSGTRDIYAYAADPANRYGKLGSSLLVVNPNTAQLISDEGAVLFDIPIRMSAPQLSIGKDLAAICDAKGDTIYLLDQNGLRRTLRTERDLRCFSARLNGSDYLAVTEQKTGYKTSVSVYNADGALLFSFDSYDNYLSDARVTEDGRSVVIVSLEPQNGIYASVLRVYDLGSAEQKSSAAIRDGLVMDFCCNGDKVISLCDKRFAITDLAGDTLLDYSYGNLYLHDYALTGGDFCALLLGRYQAGNICTLTTYDLEGQEIASMELTEEVLDIAACGDYLAVLYGERLVVYQRDLTEYARLDNTDYAGQILPEADGSVLLVSGSSAWRFLP